MAKTPHIHAKPSHLNRGLGYALVAGVAAVVSVAAAEQTFVRTPQLQNSNGQLSSVNNKLATAGAQAQARLVEHGISTPGPPIASISAGKANPTPTEIAPVSPEQTKIIVKPKVTLSFKQQNDIVGLVLRKIPKPKDGKSPSSGALSSAIQAVLAAHPELTSAQVSSAVIAYLKANPPASGNDGTNGTNGTNGINGTNGDSVTGAHICQADEDPANPYCADIAVGHLVFQITHGADGSVTYLDAGQSKGTDGTDGSVGPSGADGKDAPPAYPSNIVVNGTVCPPNDNHDYVCPTPAPSTIPVIPSITP